MKGSVAVPPAASAELARAAGTAHGTAWTSSTLGVLYFRRRGLVFAEVELVR